MSQQIEQGHYYQWLLHSSRTNNAPKEQNFIPGKQAPYRYLKVQKTSKYPNSSTSTQGRHNVQKPPKLHFVTEL
jgi:hypothetical protein